MVQLGLLASPALEAGPSTHANVTTILWLLIAVAIVAVISKYIHLPYTIVLVIAGVGIAIMPGVPLITLTPDLILLVFLPALLFEAAYNLSLDQLRENFRFISALAIWGVLGTAGLVAVLLIWLGGLHWQTALIFGAMVAATDPVSVVATFRRLKTSHRLTVIMEGESLFNDGSALVLFNLLVGIVVVGKFNFLDSLVEFLKVAVGGLALGVGVGYLALALLSHLNEYLTETLVTLIAAYGTFLAADQLGVSPALAVVAAGLLVGNFGHEKALSPSSRVAVGLSWEFLSFLANSLIFLLVGLQAQAINFSSFWVSILLAIFATLASRAVVIFFFSWLANLIKKSEVIPFKWQLMLIWGGLRGSLSLAMALSLPIALASGIAFPDRDKLLVMTFGLILFSLLAQGLTVEPLMHALKLGRSSSEQFHNYELLQGQMLTARAARQKIEELRDRSLVNEESARILKAEYEKREHSAGAQLHQLHVNNELLQEDQLKAARRGLLQIEKSTSRDLYGQGVISEEILRELWSEIDAKISQLDEGGNFENAEGLTEILAVNNLPDKKISDHDLNSGEPSQSFK